MKRACLHAWVRPITNFIAGNIFHLQYLAIACNQTPQKTCEDLDKALRGDYVIRLDDVQFKFAHDRVQQAALNLASFLVWFGLVWFGLVWFGLVWFGLVWFGLFWFVVCFGLFWFVLVCFVLFCFVLFCFVLFCFVLFFWLYYYIFDIK